MEQSLSDKEINAANVLLSFSKEPPLRLYLDCRNLENRDANNKPPPTMLTPPSEESSDGSSPPSSSSTSKKKVTNHPMPPSSLLSSKSAGKLKLSSSDGNISSNISSTVSLKKDETVISPSSLSSSLSSDTSCSPSVELVPSETTSSGLPVSAPLPYNPASTLALPNHHHLSQGGITNTAISSPTASDTPQPPPQHTGDPNSNSNSTEIVTNGVAHTNPAPSAGTETNSSSSSIDSSSHSSANSFAMPSLPSTTSTSSSHLSTSNSINPVPNPMSIISQSTPLVQPPSQPLPGEILHHHPQSYLSLPTPLHTTNGPIFAMPLPIPVSLNAMLPIVVGGAHPSSTNTAGHLSLTQRLLTAPPDPIERQTISRSISEGGGHIVDKTPAKSNPQKRTTNPTQDGKKAGGKKPRKRRGAGTGTVSNDVGTDVSTGDDKAEPTGSNGTAVRRPRPSEDAPTDDDAQTRPRKKAYIPSYVQDGEKCAVCGDNSTGTHYRAMTCEGCKGFFRRTVQNGGGERYSCKKHNNCEIGPQSRNACQSCRYQRCLDARMDPESVLKEPDRLNLRNLIENNRAQRQKRQSQILNNEESLIVAQLGSSFKSQNVRQFYSFLESIKEKSMSPVPPQISPSLQHALEFIKVIPGIDQISDNDLWTLLNHHVLDIVGLRLAEIYDKQQNTLAFSNRNVHEDAIPDYPWIERIFKYAEKYSPYVFPDGAILGCLAAVRFLSTDNLELENQELVENLQERICQILSKCLQQERVDKPHRLFLGLTTFENIRESDSLILTRQAAMDSYTPDISYFRKTRQCNSATLTNHAEHQTSNLPGAPGSSSPSSATSTGINDRHCSPMAATSFSSAISADTAHIPSTAPETIPASPAAVPGYSAISKPQAPVQSFTRQVNGIEIKPPLKMEDCPKPLSEHATYSQLAKPKSGHDSVHNSRHDQWLASKHDKMANSFDRFVENGASVRFSNTASFGGARPRIKQETPPIPSSTSGFRPVGQIVHNSMPYPSQSHLKHENTTPHTNSGYISTLTHCNQPAAGALERQRNGITDPHERQRETASNSSNGNVYHTDRRLSQQRVEERVGQPQVCQSPVLLSSISNHASYHDRNGEFHRANPTAVLQSRINDTTRYPRKQPADQADDVRNGHSIPAKTARRQSPPPANISRQQGGQGLQPSEQQQVQHTRLLVNGETHNQNRPQLPLLDRRPSQLGVERPALYGHERLQEVNARPAQGRPQIGFSPRVVSSPRISGPTARDINKMNKSLYQERPESDMDVDVSNDMMKDLLRRSEALEQRVKELSGAPRDDASLSQLRRDEERHRRDLQAFLASRTKRSNEVDLTAPLAFPPRQSVNSQRESLPQQFPSLNGYPSDNPETYNRTLLNGRESSNTHNLYSTQLSPAHIPDHHSSSPSHPSSHNPSIRLTTQYSGQQDQLSSNRNIIQALRGPPQYRQLIDDGRHVISSKRNMDIYGVSYPRSSPARGHDRELEAAVTLSSFSRESSTSQFSSARPVNHNEDLAQDLTTGPRRRDPSPEPPPRSHIVYSRNSTATDSRRYHHNPRSQSPIDFHMSNYQRSPSPSVDNRINLHAHRQRPTPTSAMENSPDYAHPYTHRRTSSFGGVQQVSPHKRRNSGPPSLPLNVFGASPATPTPPSIHPTPTNSHHHINQNHHHHDFQQRAITPANDSLSPVNIHSQQPSCTAASPEFVRRGSFSSTTPSPGGNSSSSGHRSLKKRWLSQHSSFSDADQNGSTDGQRQ